ncbi:hypothetical protein [Pseudomonas indica]|uniref:hypothetical protein n=1 Tax=Pseudomonas indica TaxID=137658 RepID=UPI003FD1C486
MSKWMKLLLLALAAGCALTLFWVTYSDERAYSENGKTAVINPNVEFSVERKAGTNKEAILAHMSYVDQNGKTVKFNRYLSKDVIEKLAAGTPVYVEYIPGEWNMERIQGQKNQTAIFALAFLACVVGFAYVARKPSDPEAESVSTPLWLAWLIRGGLLMLAVGGTLGGGAGMLSASRGMTDVILLFVGLAFTWVFVRSLRME